MRRVMVSLMTIVAACGAGSPSTGDPLGATGARTEGSPAAGAGVRRAEPQNPAQDPAQDPAQAPAQDLTGEERQYPGTVILEPRDGPPVEVRVELALTEPQRSRGLMHRRHLPDDAGMLFVFDRMEHQSFWMDNTLIPLDILFIDDRLRVVGVVHAAEPLTRDAREVEGHSQYVLEVNAGFASLHDITGGTEVRFENVPLDVGDSDDDAGPELQQEQHRGPQQEQEQEMDR